MTLAQHTSSPSSFEEILVALEMAMGTPLRDRMDLEAVREQFLGGSSLVDLVLDLDLVSDSEFGLALSREFNLPWNENPVLDEANADFLRAYCPSSIAIKHRVVPLRVEFEEGKDTPAFVELAYYDPLSSYDRHLVRRSVDAPVHFILSPRRLVRSALQKLYGVGGDIFDDLIRNRNPDDHGHQGRVEINDLDEEDEEASIMTFVNQILTEALNQRATDIHVEPIHNDLRVRFRIDGLLRKIPVPDRIVTLQSSVIARLKLMAGLRVDEKRKPQDGRIALQIKGKLIDTRVATIPGIEGESISLRLLGQEQFDIDKLGMPPSLRETVEELIAYPNGIILVTGPTGCGKSTSLFCFLSSLNSEDRKIVTIEDPVENRLEGALQIAVKPEIDLTFASGLRSILRGDPNVIMVGEIRDLETAEIAVQAALTGHLVFSTLHTNDSISGVTRLVDMGVEPFLIVAAVRAFIAQRLVRRLCFNCRILTRYTPEFLGQVGFPSDGATELYQAHPDGCEACGHSGYLGRIAIYELFPVSEAIRDLVGKEVSKQQLHEQGRKEGFITMREYGWTKVREGLTSIQEVVSATELG